MKRRRRERWTWIFLGFALAGSPASSRAIEMIDGWPVSERTFDRERIEAMGSRIASGEFPGVESVVVIEDGELLIEEYYGGTGREDFRDTRSVGKTFTSAITGIALHEGHLTSIDQPLREFYPVDDYAHPSPRKGAVTLRHLLTMTSGFDGFDFDPQSVGNEENMYPTANWVRWTLDLPMADRAPGTQWSYFTAGIVVLGDILNSVVPGGLEAYAEKTLFSPLGIRDYSWQHTPQRVANTAGGLRLRSLDLAKFGQLHKGLGQWQGEQVLPQEWVEASLSPQVDAIDGLGYGYLWWHDTFEVSGHTLRAPHCSGNGGNKIFVFPDHPWVVVITATAYGQPYAHAQVRQLMSEYILPTLLSSIADR